MGRRSVVYVVAVTVGLGVAGILGTTVFSGSSGSMSTAFGALKSPSRAIPDTVDDPGEVSLLWVVTDTVSCQDPAYTLRRIQGAYGDHLQLAVLPSGVDAASVEHILKRERLQGTVVSHEEGSYKGLLHEPFRRSLHVVGEREVLASWQLADPNSLPSFRNELENAFAAR